MKDRNRARRKPLGGRNRKRLKGRTVRLSSRSRKDRRTKGSRSERGKPESESIREALVEQLWERSGEGRKETNRKLSTGTGRPRTGNQAGANGEDRRSESESGALRKPL